MMHGQTGEINMRISCQNLNFSREKNIKNVYSLLTPENFQAVNVL